jgi:hypothetical protein
MAIKSLATTSNEAYAKKVPDGYREGKWTWAAVISDAYGDTVLESGFSSKKAAEAWIKANKGK